MKCPKCGFENRPGARFCRRCGQDLPAAQPEPSPPPHIPCPACGAAVKPLIVAPPTPQPLPAEGISVHVEGGVSGQVAIGNYVLQIGEIHGGVVNIAMPGQLPAPKPRPTPVYLRPRPFPNLLDRETEIKTTTAALQSAQPVEFQGQPGLGKTALLRHIAHHPATAAFPDGVVYLSARCQPAADLLQALFDAFYEADAPLKPTDAQLRHDLQGKRALILLDDVDLAREEVEMLLNVAPACTFLLASPDRRLWGNGQSIALHGLPPNDALALVERELGHPLTPQERPAAQALCAAVQGHPLRLIQAVAAVREEGIPLADVATRQGTQALSPVEGLKALPAAEQQILAALAVLGGAAVGADHLAALAELPDLTPALPALLRRGLVQAHSPRYSLAGDLSPALRLTWDLTPWAEHVLRHFTTWAEGQQRADLLLEESDAILQILAWATGAGHWADVLRLGRAVEGALALGGRWAAWLQVLKWILQAAQALGDQAAQGWALHQMGTHALCLGYSGNAHTLLTQALHLRQALGDQAGAAVTRHNLSLLAGAPSPPPRQKPPAPKPRSPLPKWLLPVVSIVAIATVAVGITVSVALGATILRSCVPPGTVAPVTEAPAPNHAPIPPPTPTVPMLEPPLLTLCIDFEDLPLDKSYEQGESFTASGVNVTVLNGWVEVWGQGAAGGSGNEIYVPEGRLGFDLGPLSGLSLRFAQNTTATPRFDVEVNGESRSVPFATELDGAIIGDVAVSVGKDSATRRPDPHILYRWIERHH